MNTYLCFRKCVIPSLQLSGCATTMSSWVIPVCSLFLKIIHQLFIQITKCLGSSSQVIVITENWFINRPKENTCLFPRKVNKWNQKEFYNGNVHKSKYFATQSTYEWSGESHLSLLRLSFYVCWYLFKKVTKSKVNSDPFLK